MITTPIESPVCRATPWCSTSHGAQAEPRSDHHRDAGPEEDDADEQPRQPPCELLETRERDDLEAGVADRSRRRSTSRPADSRSRYSVAWACVWRIDAGQAVSIGPSSARRTGSAFRASGTMAKTRAGAQQRRNRDRQRVGRHRVDIGEVTLPHLLAPAGVVELDDLHVGGIVEVGDRRVVEREVAVLTDPETAEVERMRPQQRCVPVALGVRVGRVAVGSRGTRPGAAARRLARACSGRSRQGGRREDRGTRPCGIRSRVTSPHHRPSRSRSRNVNCELPDANMTFARPRSRSAARITAAASPSRRAHRGHRNRRRPGRRASGRRAHANCGSQGRVASSSSSVISTSCVEVAPTGERIGEHRFEHAFPVAAHRGLHRRAPASRRSGAAARRAPAGATTGSPPADAVAVDRAHALHHHVGRAGRGTGRAFGMLSGRCRGTSRSIESMSGASISPDGARRDLVAASSASKSATCAAGPCSRSAMVVSFTPHRPPHPDCSVRKPGMNSARWRSPAAGSTPKRRNSSSLSWCCCEQGGLRPLRAAEHLRELGALGKVEEDRLAARSSSSMSVAELREAVVAGRRRGAVMTGKWFTPATSRSQVGEAGVEQQREHEPQFRSPRGRARRS